MLEDEGKGRIATETTSWPCTHWGSELSFRHSAVDWVSYMVVPDARLASSWDRVARSILFRLYLSPELRCLILRLRSAEMEYADCGAPRAPAEPNEINHGRAFTQVTVPLPSMAAVQRQCAVDV